MSVLVLRIKFPPQYPLIYKTLRINANFTCKEAVAFIAESVTVTDLLVGTEALYIPEEKRWLNDDERIANFESIQDAEYIEFRDRNQPLEVPAAKAPVQQSTSSSCCTIL